MGSDLKERRLVLFGGQGSPSIFAPNAAATAEHNARSGNSGNILLSKCHAAFLEEISSLGAELQHLLSIDLSVFTSPCDLLQPPAQYHTHPVLQATTIYLCQMLQYLKETLLRDETLEDSFDKLEATAGFSSGILPGAVVARSCTVDDFIATGIQGFRLAFWIACRSFFWALEKAGSSGHEVGEPIHVDSEATLSLVIRGLSRTEVEQKLLGHHGQAQTPNQETLKRLKVSAVSTSGTVSVSGPMADLCALKAQLQTTPNLTATFAYVHGWYHGGEQLQGAVSQVLDDISRRNISFPPQSRTSKPIYSTLDGALLYPSAVSADEFMKWITEHLLVHCVNWRDTAQEISANVRESLRQESRTAVKILSFGPSSGSLFPSFEPADSRITLLDLSPFKMSGKQAEIPSYDESDIAIVGMSVKFPKGESLEELWETISQGLDAVQEIPETRFKVSDFHAKNSDRPRSMPTKHGAFLKDPFSFDNSFFNISPREAKSMDPQQRVLLHAAQEAVEDAGYVPDSSPSSQRATTGCYIGLATGDYTDNLRDEIDTFYSTGTLRAFHSGKISYFYRFSGPSIVIDTACSSSTVAIYQACRALQSGDCTTAIAGGVNVITSPDMYLGLARGHFLSQAGGCKPFDAAADGYCRAEGCALFVLKRLSDAIAEGDRIHGVIKNILVNQSGNSNSITHPHSQTQTDLIQRLLKQKNIDPGSVSVVEAHGTGTQAGDTREVATLRNVFSQYHSPANPLMLSSIKGNIGHCEAVSGAAGLAKLLLMLREKKIPMQAGLTHLNPAFGDLQSSGLNIPRQTISWKHSKKTPRRAVLNNFGAAGSNASLLLEEWVVPQLQRSEQNQIQDRSSYIFAISAKSERALKASINHHIELLNQEKMHLSLRDICYTATARRNHYGHRISLTCNSVADLLTKIEHYKNVNSRPAQEVKAPVFVFSGQGAIYRGMGRELMNTYPPLRDLIMDCDRIIQGLGLACPSIIDFIRDNAQKETDTMKDVDQIIVSQCACVALEYALAKVFMSWGIIPDYVMGHSLGEYAALCISGAMTLGDSLRIVASRAKLMAELCLPNTSGMLACNLSSEKTQTILSQNPALAQLEIACHNSPGDCVVGGPLTQLKIFQEICSTQKIRTKLMNVPYAFHTSAMNPILGPLRALGGTVTFKQPTIPIMSNVHGRLFCGDDFCSNYFADHARQSVRFSDCLRNIQELLGEPVLNGALFLEIGPQPSLLPMLENSLPPGSGTYLGTLRRGFDAWESISETLAAISLRKIVVKWREVFTGTSARVVSLPGHLLEGSHYLVPYREYPPKSSDSNSLESSVSGTPDRVNTGYKLLPWLKASESCKEDGELVLETDMTILGSLIEGHDVGGTPICPASVFHELAIEATQILCEPSDSRVLVVKDMSFASPLIYLPSSPESSPTTVTVKATRQSSSFSSEVSFQITSFGPAKGSTETLHCTGSISVQNANANASQWARDKAIVTRQSRHFSGVGKDYVSVFKTKVLYDSIFTRVVRYSPEYQSLIHLNVSESNLEGLGSFKMPSGTEVEGYLVPPVFTDTMLHAAGFIANLAIGQEEIGICARVESIELDYQHIDYSNTFKIYCSLLEVKGAILADAIALDSADNVVAVVRAMEFKKLQLTTFRHSLSRISTNFTQPQKRDYAQYSAKTLPSFKLPTGLDTPPTTDEVGSASPTESRSGTPALKDTSQILKDIVVEVGGFREQDIDLAKSLNEHGIDSLMQIEIASKLARMFPGQKGVSHHALSQCETLEEMDDMLSTVLQPSAKNLVQETMVERLQHRLVTQPESSSQPIYSTAASISSHVSSSSNEISNPEGLPVTLHTSAGNHVPLCLFHDGSGQISMYSRLPGHDRTTYAFFDPYFGHSNLKHTFHRTLNEMATEYVFKILSNHHQQLTPLILGGWSFGGVVAFEAARQLILRGVEVKGLVLIDSPSPINHEPLPTAVIARIIEKSDQSENITSGSNTALKEEFLSNASLLGSYKPEPTTRRLKTIMLQSQEVLDTEALYGVRYDWLSRQDARDNAVLAWEQLVGGHIEVLPIPGNHFEPFSNDNIDVTAAQLWRACQHIEEAVGMKS